jgi:hypothetical protein
MFCWTAARSGAAAFIASAAFINIASASETTLAGPAARVAPASEPRASIDACGSTAVR